MDHMTTCIWKVLLTCGTHRELSPHSSVPLSSKERSIFQLVTLVFPTKNFTFLVLLLLSSISAAVNKNCFKNLWSLWLLSTKLQTDKISDELVNRMEHLAATETETILYCWWRPKTELEGGWILYLYSSGSWKHSSKLMVMPLYIYMMYKPETVHGNLNIHHLICFLVNSRHSHL